jgi:hypothetical protein
MSSATVRSAIQPRIKAITQNDSDERSQTRRIMRVLETGVYDVAAWRRLSCTETCAWITVTWGDKSDSLSPWPSGVESGQFEASGSPSNKGASANE